MEKIKNFFSHLWYELEPIVKELIVYSIIILLVAIVTNFISPYLEDKFKEAVDKIKWVLIVGALSLFAFHTIIIIFIRTIVGIIEEAKEGYDKVKKSKNDEDSSNEEDDQSKNNISEKQDLSLNPQPVNTNEVNEIQDFEKEIIKENRDKNE